MKMRNILVVKQIKLGHGWITNEGENIKNNGHASDLVPRQVVIHALELCYAKEGSQIGRMREARGQFGHFSLEDLWKFPLGSMTYSVGFWEKVLGWEHTGAALGWQHLSPFALAWPDGKATILMGPLSVDSDSTSEPTHEHGWASR